jgi:ribosomal protein S27AE
MSKETYILSTNLRCEKVRSDIERQKRPITLSKGTYEGAKLSKETYYSVKRDLVQCQKRPITVSKETYYSVKRDLLQCQKRPITVSKETYYSVKRDLLQALAGVCTAV